MSSSPAATALGIAAGAGLSLLTALLAYLTVYADVPLAILCGALAAWLARPVLTHYLARWLDGVPPGC